MNFNRFQNVTFCSLVALELHFCTLCGPFWPPEGPSWSSFGSSWTHLGLKWVSAWSLLASCWLHLEPIWEPECTCWGSWGPYWGSPGPNLPPLWPHGGQLSSKFVQLCPFDSGNWHLLVFSELRNARFNWENVCFLKVFSCIYSWIF